MIRGGLKRLKGTGSSFVADCSDRLRYRWERLRCPGVFARLESEGQFSAWLADALQGSEPFLVTRLGNVESRMIGEHVWRGSRYGRKTWKQAHQNAGIFPMEPWLFQHFSSLTLESLSQADWLGFWQSSFQAKIIDRFLPSVRMTELSSLEPFFSEKPWSASLAKKKVLVVHPFGRSILKQMQHRQDIFPSTQILPDFQLDIVLPPQTIAPATSGYATWLDALQALKSRVLEKPFDVALIGCGAYGLPLAAAVKQAGRQAIHLGGSLQLLFGIRGRRWDAIPRYQQLSTPAWRRPAMDETPEGAASVEGGCYW